MTVTRRELGSRLPSLGPRGEGWFVGQILFLIAVAAAPQGTWPEPAGTLGLWIGTALALGGALMTSLAVVDLGSNFTPLPSPLRTGALVERGIYHVLRHPVYGGLVLIAVGWSLLHASGVGLILTVALAAFLDLKARREEVLLLARFPEYEAYRRRTHRFIPRVY